MSTTYVVQDTSILKAICVRFFPKVRIGHKLNCAETCFERQTQHNNDGFMPLGAYSYSHSLFYPVSKIGRYCSIGENVKVMGNSHPVSWVSTSPINYSKRRRRVLGVGGENKGLSYSQAPKSVEIGNDVWIGQDVLLRDGINIGDGSVIAAGSVVTKDVEPYSIVAGNPARHIRWRFSKDICDRLLKSKWWDYKYDCLQHLDFEHPERFLTELNDSTDVLVPLEEQRMTIFEHINMQTIS